MFKKKKNEEEIKDRVEKLFNFLQTRKEPIAVDSSLLRTMIEVEMSDMVFNQHTQSGMSMNILMLTVQLGALLLSVILAIYGIHTEWMVCCISIVTMFYIIANNIIHNIAWKRARIHKEVIGLAVSLLSRQVTYYKEQADSTKDSAQEEHIESEVEK